MGKSAPASTARARPNVLITGTPGTGKSSLAERVAAAAGMTHVDVSALAKAEDLIESYDEALDTHVIDEDKVLDHMEERLGTSEGGVVVDYHSCDIFPERWFDLVVVLTCDNSELYDRLKRGVTSRENLEEHRVRDLPRDRGGGEGQRRRGDRASCPSNDIDEMEQTPPTSKRGSTPGRAVTAGELAVSCFTFGSFVSITLGSSHVSVGVVLSHHHARSGRARTRPSVALSVHHPSVLLSDTRIVPNPFTTFRLSHRSSSCFSSSSSASGSALNTPTVRHSRLNPNLVWRSSRFPRLAIVDPHAAVLKGILRKFDVTARHSAHGDVELERRPPASTSRR